MNTSYNTKERVIERAKTILNRSLRDVIPEDKIQEVEKELEFYASRRKGFLGELVERFIFELDVNNRSEADFKLAGVELKTNPLKEHSTKRFVSKERLVFSMIDYNKIVDETWETSSFLKKNKLLLLMFYVWLKEESVLDYQFKFVHLLNLLEDIPEADVLQIKTDWQYIVEKIKRGEAHLLSEADTYFLGACTKASNSKVVRDQPNGKRHPAKPRAFSFKQQYLNYLNQKYLLGEEASTEPILKKERRVATVEQIVSEKLSQYIGKTDREIRFMLDWDTAVKPKSYKRLLSNRMLGVRSNRLEELEKANVTLKVVTLEHTGTLRESISFPTFDYKDLASDVWYDEDGGYMSEFHAQLETKKFLFVVFQKIKDSDQIRFKTFKFWNFPMVDMPEARRVWEQTVTCIQAGEYDNLPKISESDVVHVRPHGKDSADTLETPQGKEEVKRSFWLNAKYIQKVLEERG